MKDKWKEIQPKNIFKAVIHHPLSNQEQEVLTFLYQPIVGASAFSLYLTLLSEIDDSGMSESLFHADLITMLDLSIQQLEKARLKLEGIGLLETFVKVDAELGDSYIYRLNHPESAEHFFKDEVLTLTLFTIIGQRKLDKLFNRFKPKFVNLSGYENISVGFKEVYLFKEEQINAHSEMLNTMQHSFHDATPATKITAVSETFDWNYFISGIERLGIKLPENEAGFKEEIYIFHNLFGINELEMVDFASKSFDYYTNQIVVKDFERSIYLSKDPDKKQAKATPLRNQQVNLSEADQQTYRYNSLKLEGFSEQDIQMIMDSESNFPLNYLEALKAGRGGYTTPQERSLVKYLVSKSGLPNSVINILINYVYNIQKQPTLKADYVNRIANEWAQSKIFSPEKAISHVRALAKKGKEKQQNRSKYNNGKPIRQEVLPDWVNNPVAEEKLSIEEQEKLDKEMEKFLKRRGDN